MGQAFLEGLDLVTGPRNKTKKSTNRSNAYGGVSEEEKLIYAGDKDCPDETNHPSTEGRRRHGWIICVGNGRMDFWIWGFILKRKGRWVKIWVVVVPDSNAPLLCVFLQSVSGGSTLQPRRKGIN